ncbi:MAG: hypothetical protein PHR81_12615 [Bacteroidales bacterium]|jgi:hypothetical protein|nr:hypothetical protein [Bacteroidales bacterium]MDD4215645.1 hypothetical protein [Bacteroidales bacterium]
MCKKYFFVIISFCFVLFVKTAISQENPEIITERFFEIYQEQSTDDAVDYVFATNKWLNSDRTVQENIKIQLKKGIAMIGQFYGYELIEKKVLSESYVMLNYMLKYDRQPIKFTFILYKPNTIWQIQNLKFDDRLEDDIESMKK